MGLGAVVSSPCRANWRQRRIQRSSSACVMQEAPFAEKEAPFAGQEVPLAGLEAPFAELETPFAGQEVPLAGFEAPFAELKVPFAELASSSAAQVSPTPAQESP